MSVCVLGSINLDIVCRVAELPHPGQTVMALDVQRFPGGKGANQAVASARWGAPTAMIGAVGRDEAGEDLLAHLVSAGVDTAGIRRLAGAPTGVAHINVSDAGENMIVVIGGANRSVSAEHISTHRTDSHRVVLAQLETPVSAIQALFAQTTSATKILNAAPAIDEAKALFRLADILVVNQSELAHYVQTATTEDSHIDLLTVARRLIAHRDQQVVVTLGARGAVAIDANDIISVAGSAVEVVDTTGAGDCFCGVLAASVDEGIPLPEALMRANRAAAVSTCRAGAAVSPDLRAEAEALG
jgi:ribokinase